MEFRNYLENDAKEILNWIKSERDFRLWSADRYDSYPINEKDINNNYENSKKISNFYPMTLVDNGKIIGHLILRNSNNNKEEIRLGFIIVNSDLRGMGYGKKLILNAIDYAINKLNAKKISLGVFDVNESSYYCYKSCGFIDVDTIYNAYQYKDEVWNQKEMILKR